MKEHVPGYLWETYIPSINNIELLKEVLSVEEYLNSQFPIPEDGLSIFGSQTTRNYQKYNLFTFLKHSIQQVYWEINKIITPIIPEETHVIQCWLNVFRAGERIDWHDHWPESFRAIHGFYCVNVEPSSFTEYKFSHLSKHITRVESRNGLLVFGKSAGDFHRSSVWENTSTPRVTIAFDVIPLSTLIPHPFSRRDVANKIPFKS